MIAESSFSVSKRLLGDNRTFNESANIRSALVLRFNREQWNMTSLRSPTMSVEETKDEEWESDYVLEDRVLGLIKTSIMKS